MFYKCILNGSINDNQQMIKCYSCRQKVIAHKTAYHGGAYYHFKCLLRRIQYAI